MHTREEECHLRVVVVVSRFSPRQIDPAAPPAMYRQELNHARVFLLSQGVLQEERLPGERDKLLEMVDRRLPQMMQMNGHEFHQLCVYSLGLWAGGLLTLCQNPLHSSHMLTHLLVELSRHHAAQLLCLVRRSSQHVSNLLSHLVQVPLLAALQSIAILVIVGQSYCRVAEHHQQHDASNTLDKAGILSHALFGPGCVLKAAQLDEV
mmetsp:Transcript_47610/g.111341  ORF Transcript_47610/g.111341 Transcript_47610/m.111341 type:complete len:207 (+) Transcript_47610:999-1619(+)